MKRNIIHSFISTLCLLSLFGCLGDDVPSSEDQLNADIQSIDTYLSSKGITAIKDASGVRFTVESLGTGYVPMYNSKVGFTFTGKLLSGSTFQSGSLNDSAIKELILGMQIGLRLIPVGTKATFYIPSVFGYGREAKGNIPPNSNLIFEIYLKNLVVTDAEKNQLKADTILIDSYISTAGVTNVTRDTSGLRYKITEAGTGAAPTSFNKVKIEYTGYFINSNGTLSAKFFEGVNEPTSTNDNRVVNFIRGFQLGLMKMRAGGRASLYVPSVLGFGSEQVDGLITIPANSSLLYEVKLVEVLAP